MASKNFKEYGNMRIISAEGKDLFLHLRLLSLLSGSYESCVSRTIIMPYNYTIGRKICQANREK